MPFVATKFPLPTVSKADGTLGAYVQYPVNPGGTQFIWPAQRIAILLAKQKADKAKKKSALGAVTLPPAGPAGDVVNAVYQAGPNATGQNATVKDAVNRLAAANQQPNQGMSYALALGGILVAGGVIIALVKALSGAPRTGRPIPGAHVYEGL